MGDRANIGFSAGTSTDECVWLYTHWTGSTLPDLAVRAVAAAQPRWGDANYATRIALTTLIGRLAEPTGWGVSTGPDDNQHDGIIIDWHDKVYRILPAATVDDWYTTGPGSRVLAITAAPTLPFGATADDIRAVWH